MHGTVVDCLCVQRILVQVFGRERFRLAHVQGSYWPLVFPTDLNTPGGGCFTGHRSHRMLKFSLIMQSSIARSLADVDPAIHELILQETRRQDGQIELIASENFTSEAVLEATG